MPAKQPLCYAWLVLVLVVAPLHRLGSCVSAETPPAGQAATRLFIDEGYFLEGDTEILRAYISASNGRMMISGESSAAFLSVKGYYVPESWDVYWTIRQACHMAFKHMQPHQRVNCIPGISAMSLKRTFVSTWQQAYGELAFNFIPRSYLIPEQYWLWRSYLLASASPPDRKWVLKANIHRGKGVSVVPQQEALSHALTHKHERHSSTSSSDGGSSSSGDNPQYLNVLVQSYLQQQLVIAGRSSYIRVWLLVTSINPLRAYLFDGGFAIFGKQKGAAGAAAAGAAARSGNKTAGSSSDDLIVNLWIQDRDSSPIWSLKHLQEYLAQHPEVVLPPPAAEKRPQQQPQGAQPGRRLQQATALGSSSTGRGRSRALQQQQQQPQRRTFADAWKDMQTSASLVLAAALPAMRAAAAEANAPQQGAFEYFGLDFVLDAHLRPWMLEVNAIPSMARRKKSDCSGEAATAHCKLKTAGADSAPGASNSTSNSSSSSAGGKAASDLALDDFDAQKEWFVHDMLVLLGLPVDGGAADAAAVAAAATAGSGGASQKAPMDGEGLLRLAAAAAAAAGIRSPAPAPAAPATAAASSSSSTDRRLLSTAAGAAKPQEGLHGGLQRPWLPQTQHRGQQRQLLQPRLHAHDALPTAGSAGPMDSQNSSSTTSSSSSSSSSEDDHRSQPAAPQGYKGVGGLQWSGPPPDIKELPGQLQKLLCSPTGTAADSSSSSISGFACITCLTADDLAGLAAAEGELQRAGRFVPVHDLITAHSTNQEALKQAAASAAAGNSTHGSSSTAAGDSSAAAGAAGSLPGSQYLSPSRSVWQKLYRAWKGLSQGGVGVGDLAVMQYYTTASTLSAEKRLGLQRLDYVMSAWLRVRQEEGCAGLQGADCVVKRLGLLVSKCYLE